MALAREQRDTSQTLLAAHNSLVRPSSAITTNAIAFSRPGTATSTITSEIAADHQHHQLRNRKNSVADAGGSSSSHYCPQPPFIIGHSYATEWRSACQIESARLKLVPRNLRRDTAGPMSYPLSSAGFEQLSTTKGRPFGGQVDQHYAKYAADIAAVTGGGNNNNNNSDGNDHHQQHSSSSSSKFDKTRIIRGICTFGNSPRMLSGDIHNELSRASGHRPSSAASRIKSPRSQLSELEKKFGPLRLEMADGTSLPGNSYRKVFPTPAACEYDVRRATSLTKERAPRCSFGTSARFDGGSEESSRCRPSPRKENSSTPNAKESKK